jgi:hypothetical protein
MAVQMGRAPSGACADRGFHEGPTAPESGLGRGMINFVKRLQELSEARPRSLSVSRAACSRGRTATARQVDLVALRDGVGSLTGARARDVKWPRERPGVARRGPALSGVVRTAEGGRRPAQRPFVGPAGVGRRSADVNCAHIRTSRGPATGHRRPGAAVRSGRIARTPRLRSSGAARRASRRPAAGRRRSPSPGRTPARAAAARRRWASRTPGARGRRCGTARRCRRSGPTTSR